MKKKSRSKSVLICLFTVLAFAVYNSPARAETRTWRCTSDDWFNPTCWEPLGVPTFLTDAFINNGGKATINGPVAMAMARSLTLGANAGESGTVSVQGGGSLNVPGECAEAPETIFPGLISVGYGGRGTLSISSGGKVTSGYAFIAALVGSAIVGGSNGAVTVDGASSTFTISDGCVARLFIGGSLSESGDDRGGTALLKVTNGGTVMVNNPSNQLSIKVGISGTLTGNGTLMADGLGNPQHPYLPYLTAVQGTLAPTGQLKFERDLAVTRFGTMVCNVTPGAADMVQVSRTGDLNGRLSVTMTGTFTPGTTYTLLHADGGLAPNTTFSSVSINYPPCPGYTPVVTYDANNVYLYLEPAPTCH